MQHNHVTVCHLNCTDVSDLDKKSLNLSKVQTVSDQTYLIDAGLEIANYISACPCFKNESVSANFTEQDVIAFLAVYKVVAEAAEQPIAAGTTG